MDALIKQKISSLNQTDKLELMELLWVNLRELHPTDDVKQFHIEVLKNRIANFRTTEKTSKPWTEVMKKYEK
jgi:hypothetical protein